MNKMRNVSLALVFTFAGSLGLTACGGDTPATATLPPPTATSAPPTATLAPPTATTASSSAALPTTSGSGSTTSSTPAASSPDMAFVRSAVSATQTLNSYRYVLTASGSAITDTVNIQGDYIGPDSAYVKGTIGSQQVEEIVVNNKAYSKDASGNWVEIQPSTNPATGIIDPKDIVATANPLADVAQLLDAGSDLKQVATENVNGKDTKHYTFVLDAQKMISGQSGQQLPAGIGASIPPVGGGGVWVDSDGKYIERLEMNIDTGPLTQVITDMASALLGTPTPGGPAPTAVPSQAINIRIDISHQNDPSLKLPAMPAGAAHATPTETSAPTQTGGLDATATTQP